MKNMIENEVKSILADIMEDYQKGRAVDKMDIYNQPDKAEIMSILDELFSVVCPGFFRDKTHKIYLQLYILLALISYLTNFYLFQFAT